ILEQGWSDAAGAFTQTFGGTQLDASNLLIPIVGFLPPNDSRVIATIDATERGLTDDKGLVYRYRADDGLAGDEGAFLLCTFWLAEALARAGEPERAREVFERAAAYCNDVDLLSEEVDVSTGELIGNFPQAFSHVGLINAAWAITEAEQGHDRHQRSGGLPRVV
ncbi:MAG: glycoside hydrolase family 15 protein, partial [Actinomycetota bacterium]|nr:glycoside hydrolase family 15 protein [Actinomycetota bacterium]